MQETESMTETSYTRRSTGNDGTEERKQTRKQVTP